MGKAFAHKREKKNDNLPTPYSMTKQLLEQELFYGNGQTILEPARGEGAIEKIIKKYFGEENLWSYDINDKYEPQDFMDEKIDYDYVITNPPWSLWNQFVEKSKQVATERFALLGDIDFLSGKARFENNLYQDGKYNLKEIHMFVRKCDLRGELREDGRYPAGMIHYAWYIFENGYTGKPTFNWINNQKYILSK